MNTDSAMKIATKLLRLMSFVALVLLGPRLACSCTCEVNEDGSPKAELHYTRSVFVGEVLEIRKPTADEIQQGQGLSGHLVRMRVERYWKGIKSVEISVTSDLTGCGPNLQVGKKYLVAVIASTPGLPLFALTRANACVREGQH